MKNSKLFLLIKHMDNLEKKNKKEKFIQELKKEFKLLIYSIEIVSLVIWETVKNISLSIREIIVWFLNLKKSIIIYILIYFNTYPNFIWNSNLNFFQNILYNLYVPNSHGKPSMHTTLVVWTVVLCTITLLLELRRFYLDDKYSLSTGFYGILAGLATGVIISFTNFEIQKMKNNTKKDNSNEESNTNSIKNKIVDYQNPDHD